MRAFLRDKVPLLSVCVVTFNSAHVIESCLSALRAAVEYSGISCELCIVDNASEDDSVAIVRRSWEDALVIQNMQNMGYAKAANQAAAATNGRWLLFINPDSIVPQEIFEVLRKVDQLQQVQVFSPVFVNQSGDIVRSSYRWPTLGKELLRLVGIAALLVRLFPNRVQPLAYTSKILLPPPLGEAYVVDYPVGACLFIRRSAWNRVGPFDEGFFLYHEEMEWCWRAAQLGIRAVVIPKLKVLHLEKQSSNRRPKQVIFWRYQGLLRFYCKHKTFWQRLILRAGLFISFGFRSIVSLLFSWRMVDTYFRTAVLAWTPCRLPMSRPSNRK